MYHQIVLHTKLNLCLCSAFMYLKLFLEPFWFTTHWDVNYWGIWYKCRWQYNHWRNAHQWECAVDKLHITLADWRLLSYSYNLINHWNDARDKLHLRFFIVTLSTGVKAKGKKIILVDVLCTVLPYHLIFCTLLRTIVHMWYLQLQLSLE
jgi:hypothetical protein